MEGVGAERPGLVGGERRPSRCEHEAELRRDDRRDRDATPGRPGEQPALVLGGLGGGLEQGGLPGDAQDQFRVEAPDAEGGMASRVRRGAGDGTAHGAEACRAFSS